MKLLVIANSSNGLYSFRKELLQELIKRKNDIVLITRDSGDIEKLIEIGCNVTIIDISRRSKNIINEMKVCFNYYKKIKEIKPDKIITYTIKPNIYVGFMTRLLKIDFYPNITGLGTAFQKEGIFKKLICVAYRFSFKRAKKVFFENTFNNEVFIKEKICIEKNSVILNGAGVNIDEFKFEELPDSKTINFIFMGRVMKEKGIEELFYAIREVKKKYSNVNFMILGALEENYKEELEQMEREGLLKYYGTQKDVKKYIKMAHCCILPSYHEGMSNTLLECASMGRALITSDIPGCREAVIAKKTGFLHEVKNKKDLQKKIEKYIELSVDKKIEMGIESRGHIERKFDKKRVVEETIQQLRG